MKLKKKKFSLTPEIHTKYDKALQARKLYNKYIQHGSILLLIEFFLNKFVADSILGSTFLENLFFKKYIYIHIYMDVHISVLICNIS
jgi:hypothetical protein